MKLRLNNNNGKLGFTLIELMVVIAILASVAAIGYPAYMKHMRDGELQKAQENLKSVHLMLTEFKQDHNTFPCDRSAEDLTEADPDINFGVLTGDYSNCYFRQLLYSKGAVEKNFYASISPGGRATKEPDDKKAGGKALARGENAFAYVMRKSSDNPEVKEPVNGANVPLAMCGIYPSDTPYSGDQMVFDNTSFGGKALVLRTDGSVTDLEKDLEESDDDSKATLKKSVDIFPEKRDGSSTAPNYYVLSPEL